MKSDPWRTRSISPGGEGMLREEKGLLRRKAEVLKTYKTKDGTDGEGNG